MRKSVCHVKPSLPVSLNPPSVTKSVCHEKSLLELELKIQCELSSRGAKRDVGKRPNVLKCRAAQDLVLTKVLYLHTMGLNSEGKFGHHE